MIPYSENHKTERNFTKTTDILGIKKIITIDETKTSSSIFSIKEINN